MRYSCKASIEYDLKMHLELQSKYEDILKSLSNYKGCRIKTVKRINGTFFYAVRHAGETKYKYIGSDDKEEILHIREYSYFEKALSVISSNITAMEDFLSVYRLTHADTINELLGSIYQLPTSELYMLSEPEVNDWLNKAHSIKSIYPVYDPASLKVSAFDGTKMRSRAEAIHYEAFFIYDIPVVFELPYKIGDDIFRPDFTLLDVFNMSPVIWEHLGHWFHSDDYKRNNYRQESIHRWDEYSKIGFFPEVNLMLSFGSKDNIFDISALHRKIAMFAAPPISKDTIELLRRC